MPETDKYENFKRIVTAQGQEKIDAIALYLKSMIDEGTISWPAGLKPPSFEDLQDTASYMAPVFVTVPEEKADEILKSRTLLFLVGIMRNTLRELGGWTAQDKQLGFRMV